MRASLRALLGRRRRWLWPLTLVVTARQIPRVFLQVEHLQRERCREARAHMRTELLELILELAEPVVAGHDGVKGPNTASMPAATFGLFHDPSRANTMYAASVTLPGVRSGLQLP